MEEKVDGKAYSITQSSDNSAGEARDLEAIRAILDRQMLGWNSGNAAMYADDLYDDIVFTNIRGDSFRGAEGFIKQHEFIFATFFRGTSVSQDIEEIVFPANDVAIVQLLTCVSGIEGMPPHALLDSKGRLRTRLMQVFTRKADGWKVAGYHNVDVKRGVELPEPGTI
ncbi:MAG TPA: SgcJ/EcaC family oxidoreductase [Gemmatimonadaceae bacterium]